MGGSRSDLNHAAGLCADCRYARAIRSDRGSIFLQCERHFQDKQFAKYPRLPVRICAGYTPIPKDQA